MRERKLKLSINRNLALALMVFLILPALIAGYTYAVVAPQNGWFTDEYELNNTFTAGTLSIEVNNPELFDAVDNIAFDPCAGLSYLITNTGTKRNYVRVKFEGGWERGYHVNTATVSVAGTDIEKSDSAHFRYDTESYSPPAGLTGEFGFTDSKVLGPVQFSPLGFWSGGGNSRYDTDGDHSFGGVQFGNGGSSSEAEGEIFRIKFIPGSGWLSGYLADVETLFGTHCEYGLKITTNIDEEDIGEEETIIFSDGLELTIFKNEEDGTFSFESNYPIYHVFVKGGSGGHNLYTYYINKNKSSPITFGNEISIPFVDDENNRIYSLPFSRDNLSENGVYSGTGLQQVGQSWSHANFMYCIPTLKTGIEIVKLVSLNGGDYWQTKSGEIGSDYAKVIELLRTSYGYSIDTYEYTDEYSWPVSSKNPNEVPVFQIVVVNTGDTNLTGIQVTDDSFAGFIVDPIDLNAGQVWFSPRIKFTGYLDPLPTNMVTVKLSKPISPDWDPKKWSPYDIENDLPINQNLKDYFYYKSELGSRGQIPLYVNVCLDDSNLTKEYNGAVFKLYAYFEAIQFTNQMDLANWKFSVQTLE